MYPAVIAHRGACFYAPENTLAAFENAAKLNYQMVEFDVQLSKDLQPMVFHDDDLRRLAQRPERIMDLNADQLQQIAIAHPSAKNFSDTTIPTLRQVISVLAQHNLQANVEIKPMAGYEKLTTKKTLELLLSQWPSQLAPPLISSFSLESLLMARTISKDLPMGLLLHNWDPNWQTLAEKLNCYSVHLNKWLLQPQRIYAIKKAGYKLLTYTINQTALAKTLLRLGVDGLFTDQIILSST